ncbi:MAG TPA: FAD-dependent oxidoreductase [Mesorhizobium sp.]|jgi:2-polyprenyl-6-methoxyphenol hydroxylase-like FAD-dependent oxidoreductase|nr:FAD-dependent oxidoreductase [Mesorhizobium sp.]
MLGHEADGMRVAVAGGSIGGLAAATALRSVGCAVEVYERTPHQMTSRGAGIVVQPALTALLSKVGAPPLPTTSCAHRNYLSPNGGGLSPMPQRFTSWEAIYRTLLAALPGESYHLGVEVGGSEHDGAVGPVSVRLRDGRRADADLLVCADGWRSAARARLLPDVAPRYAGYIAWRGTLAEVDAPGDLVRFFDDRFTFSDARSGGHALCYLIPGDGARTAAGHRRLNWVWYAHVPQGPELDRILTDRSGERRTGSVSPGLLAEDVTEELRRVATRELYPTFAELIAATPEPFVQVILDLAVPRMRFGRACLVGDAAFIVRPHTAGATAKAAEDALALARAAQAWRTGALDSELARWEADQLTAGRAMVHYGVALGQRFTAAR